MQTDFLSFSSAAEKSLRSASNEMTCDVLLREVTEDDLAIFFEQQLDPEANHMAAFPARDLVTFLAHWIRVLADQTVEKKTILFAGQVAGNIVSFQQSGQPLVGYWIGKNYWGRGVATKALSQFLVQVEARPLYARVAKHNVASMRVLEKCGFAICVEDTEVSEAGGEEIDELLLKLGT